MKTQNKTQALRLGKASNWWKWMAGAVTMLILTAWTAHADQLDASINGFGGVPGGQILQYNPSGKQSTVISGTEAALNGGLRRARGLAFDKNNNLFVATTDFDGTNFNGTIFKITPGGKISTFATGFGGVGSNFFLEGVTTDSGGNVFVVALDENDPNVASTIFLITPNGTLSTFGSTPGQSFDVAFDSAGNLFVSDVIDQTIFKFTQAGVRSVFAGPSNFTAVQAPVGLAFDRSGNLFVSTEGNNGNDAILKFTPAGIVSTFATGLSQVPRGLAFDVLGNLFVAETGQGSPGDIVKITPAGVMSFFALGLGDNESFSPGAEFLAFK